MLLGQASHGAVKPVACGPVAVACIKEEDLAAFLSRQYGVPSINLSEFEIDESVIKLIPAEVVQKYQLIPVNRAGSTLIVAMADPSNIFAIDDIKFHLRRKVRTIPIGNFWEGRLMSEFFSGLTSISDIVEDASDYLSIINVSMR